MGVAALFRDRNACAIRLSTLALGAALLVLLSVDRKVETSTQPYKAQGRVRYQPQGELKREVRPRRSLPVCSCGTGDNVMLNRIQDKVKPTHVSGSLDPAIVKRVFERHCDWTPPESFLSKIASTGYAVPDLVGASTEHCPKSSLPWTSVDLW
jgi:hypothetical protein